jgi:hypothetical protein
MKNIQTALGSVVSKLSDQTYEQSLVEFRFLFEIGQTYSQIPSDLIIDTIWIHRVTSPSPGGFIYPAAHLILRLASDAESDNILGPHSAGLQSRLHAKILQEFFDNQLGIMHGGSIGWPNLWMDVNLIAHCANLGYIGEATIRNHILQLFISHPHQQGYQAQALIILFQLAGATFEAYVDPSVVDRCFELLKGSDPGCVGTERVRVRTSYTVKDGHRLRDFQELISLRERGWEDLPPPPVFTTSKPKPTDADQKDPAATPVATSLGLPSGNPEPQIPQSPPPEPVVIPETDTMIPASPVAQSPSISIASLSDFTIADTSDDEPLTDATIADALDDEPPIDDPTATAPHEAFYFEDGSVEVLCGNTLFRVHPSIMSLHSPALRRMFARTSLDMAESPNGCPRILSSDTATDFATLLKTIYLPG